MPLLPLRIILAVGALVQRPSDKWSTGNLRKLPEKSVSGTICGDCCLQENELERILSIHKYLSRTCTDALVGAAEVKTMAAIILELFY